MVVEAAVQRPICPSASVWRAETLRLSSGARASSRVLRYQVHCFFSLPLLNTGKGPVPDPRLSILLYSISGDSVWTPFAD
jgi:hypothetical protein